MRNPNLVFVGMPLVGSMCRETSIGWALFEEGKKIGPYSFIPRRFSGYGIPKARNFLTWLAMTTDASKILFCDSDIVWNADHVTRILSHKEPIVGGLYPKKKIGLEWVCNFANSTQREDGLAECIDIGGGFLCVDLAVVDAMIARFPETSYVSEDPENRGAVMHDLWANGVVTDNWGGNLNAWPRYLTEDHYFCWRAKQCGFTVFADTQCQVGHIGAVDYLELGMVLG